MLQFGHKSELLDGAIPAPAIVMPRPDALADDAPEPRLRKADETASQAPELSGWPATLAADAPPISASAQEAGGLKPSAHIARRMSALGPLAALSAHAAIILALLIVLPLPGNLQAPQESVVELEIINSPSQMAVSEGEKGQEPMRDPTQIAVELPPPAPEPDFSRIEPQQPPAQIAVQLPPPAPDPVFPPPEIAPPRKPEAPPAPDLLVELPPPAPNPAFAIAPPPVTAPPKPDPHKLEQERQRALARQKARELARERTAEKARERERQQARMAETARQKQTQEKQRELARRKAARQKADATDQKRAREAARARQAARASAGRAAAAGYSTRVVSKLRGAQYYPPAARARNAKGVAVVSFSISPSGAATGIRIARSSGDRDLDSAALGTVRRASPFPAPPPGASRSFSAPMRFNAR